MQQRAREMFHDASHEQSPFPISVSYDSAAYSSLVGDVAIFLSSSSLSLHHFCCCHVMCLCCR